MDARPTVHPCAGRQNTQGHGPTLPNTALSVKISHSASSEVQ